MLALAGSLLLALPLAWASQATAQPATAQPATAQPATAQPALAAHTTAAKKAPKPTGADTSWQKQPQERTFPADSGMVNVKTDYGAVGDGVHDDTAAIQAAIQGTIRRQDVSRILYFPAGTYLVSKPLVWKNPSGGFDAELTLQGENQGKTVIKLTDHNPLFQNATLPNSVIQTDSLNPSSADAAAGGGNNGFDNYLFDLTVDTGRGNPGANAVNFIGNNYCGLRDVTLRSGDPKHIGVAGLAMMRYATGPCMMKNLSVDGFQYGVEAGRQEYSVTFDNVALKNQLDAGIINTDNVLSIENLSSQNTVPAVENFGSSATGFSGLVTLIGATLKGGSHQVSAIQNFQTLYARNVVTTGYKSAISDSQMQPVKGATVTEYDSGPTYTQFGGGSSSLNLPVKPTPQFEETDLSKWASVVTFGADPTGAKDSAAAVQAAIDSGATTVYFPAGRYILNSPVTVRGNVRAIEGFDSRVVPNGPTYTSASATTRTPFFIFANDNDVIVDHIRFGNGSVTYPGLLYVQNNSSHAVTIRDTVFDRLDPGNLYQNGPNGTGDLFIEDVTGSGWTIQGPQHVYARQFDPEGGIPKVINDGGTLWVFGLKVERPSDATHVAGVIDTEDGGSTELLGGLIYPVVTVPVNQAAFVVNNSRASFVYAVSVHNPLVADPNTPDGDFKIQVQETQDGVTSNLLSTTVFAQDSRGPQGVMMPLYTSKP
ncbi:hypothetical protein GCM10023322_43170 [Rugosimonospora acidiphila]|uniref:Rhamnogalacturonase A/B/Epimerase-like pectate lyase domain-containing protein n=1 Tax=Rugosimonospora acidiphila TaxID=556531 RepID=A0ABP9S2I2_9ACTN